jgi:hypothetical protein
LAENEIVYQIAEALTRPRPLRELLDDLQQRVGRPVPEEEVLLWLAHGDFDCQGIDPQVCDYGRPFAKTQS